VLRTAGLRRALRVAHYALVVVTAYAGAVVVVKAADLDLEPDLPEVSTAPVREQDDGQRRVGEGVIFRRNLFGVAGVEADEDVTVAASRADLRLRGVAQGEQGAFAVFEDKASGKQNVFAVGDKVFDGPRLVSVDARSAIVAYKGKKQRYELEEDQAQDGGEDRKNRDRSGKTASSANAGGIRKTGDSAFLVDRREVDHSVANLNEVITQVRAVPVLKDGQSSGFKLFNIRGGSIFERMGLQDGDIVQRVNDNELSDPSRAIGLLEEVQSMGEIRVDFLRAGKPHSYRYTIQ